MIQKEEKQTFSIVPTTQALEEAGIPIATAVFQAPIQSFNGMGGAGEPEFALYCDEPDPTKRPKKSRIAEMYYTPHGLLCKQKYGTILVPLANVKFTKVK